MQFLFLIVFAYLKKALGNDFSVAAVLFGMRNSKCKVYTNEVFVCEPTRAQKEICKKLDIVVPKPWDFRHSSYQHSLF